MPLVVRAALALQAVGTAAALGGLRLQETEEGSPGILDPSEPLYGWKTGNAFRDGGPDVVSNDRRLAGARPKDGERWSKPSQFPVHLQARLLLPKAKLAFCYMPKVASSQMASLFHEMLRGFEAVWWMNPWETASPTTLNIDWDDVTKEKGWKFAFFNRDPLARYLSAFGSKCVVNAETGVVEGAGKDCLGNILWSPVDMDTLIKTFEERVVNDTLRGAPVENSHWVPMIKNLRACGIDKFHPSLVDFHGSIDEDANAQVKRMFEQMGVLPVYPDANALVDKYFPKASVSGHHSRTHNKIDDFYRNASIAEAVEKLYEEDYQRFGLPRPRNS